MRDERVPCRGKDPALRRGRAVALVLGLIVALPHGAAATLVNRIVATVDGAPVTLYELNRYGAQTIRGRELSATDRKALLDALILDKIVSMESKAAGMEVPESEVDAYIETIKERNQLDDMQLRQALEAQGMTYEGYRQQIRSEVERQRLVAREIRGRVNVTPEDVKRYYDANRAAYAKPARFRVAHIVFAVAPNAPPSEGIAIQAKAQEVYQRLRAGADFAKMAEELSDDGGKDGGVLGWFQPGQLVDSLEDAARGLRVGQVAEPVRGPQGFHIVKLLDREDESYEPLASVEEQIKEKLYVEAIESRYERWLNEELRKRRHVEYR